MNHEKKLSL
jgi:hypothetical protein